ncbi:DsbA family protein [Halocynthiibacter sp. C4]|uniref:DsbA family protein n=1 Tax=Halocynthiibacter sp. C4 TaxID=2992758 RepID=UPI00237B9F28|nr:DsbA family protein [Halocynthiibacter sp. C4]MDE0588360.1 DsbA family protein [Halocynthiibacter sp. C4]
MLRHSFAALVLALSAAAVPAQAEWSEEELRELVLETIRSNPEIVMEAVAILQEREEAAQAEQAKDILSQQRVLLETDPNAPVLGNPDGDVTVIEFFDYNCPYCKRAGEEVTALIEEDSNVRIVYREWPILGEGSVVASRAALASRVQGKYEEFHTALMTAKGRLDEKSVFKIAKSAGLDVDQLRTDMEAPEIDEHIATSHRLAQSLGFSGTPSFVIGDELVPGMVQLPTLIDMVEAARDQS